MKTRLFVMMSLAGLAGLLTATAMPGCSSDPAASPEADAAPDVTLDTRRPTPEAAPEEEDAEAGPSICPTATPIGATDLPVKWQPPPPVAADACTQENIDALKAAFKASTTGSVKFTEIKTALGATCSACVFSPINTDGGLTSTWSVFVETTTGAFDNRTASCFARLKDANCGRTRSQWEFCLRQACPLTTATTPGCETDTDVSNCKVKVQGGACKDLTDEYVAACPMETEMLDACNIYSSIAFSCSGGTDAGIDAAPPN